MKSNIILIFVVFLLSIFNLMGCFEQKKDLTSEEFISIVSKYGYKNFEEVKNSVDNNKVNIDAMKNFFDNIIQIRNIKNKTQLVNIDISTNFELSMINFIEFEDERYAKEIFNGWEDLRIKKGLGQLPLKQGDDSITNFEEFSVGKAKRLVVTYYISDDNLGKQNFYVYFSQVGKNVVQILYIGKGKKDIDKMLNELGF